MIDRSMSLYILIIDCEENSFYSTLLISE